MANTYRNRRQRDEHFNDPDGIPRAFHQPWKYTPPLLNSNSFPFAAFTSQLPGCFAPTAEGASALYYGEDVGLSIPGVGMGMGREMPPVPPTSGNGVCNEWMTDRHYILPQTAQPYEFYSFDLSDPHQNLAPYYLSDEQLDDGPLDASRETSPIDADRIETEIYSDSPSIISPRSCDTSMSAPLRASAEKFRFHVTLDAATAMTNQADETPVTYLNKGHVYSVLIVDTAPPMPGSIPVQYRTAIRMSFQDGQQGQAAARHWKLWKDGRRTKDGHQCGGELHGVEYVEEPRVTEDHGKRARANLESAPLDGFSVLWTPGSGSSADCRIAIRFNFLSTDFTHSKGVKGILTRLCAKTEVVSPTSLHCSQEVPEICFCEVKVFRDHGAERKLSNDIASVKKTINKLKQQISPVDTTSGKRRRDGSIDTKVTQNGPNIMRKRKRTWPMSSASPTKEDLPFKLQMMQNMLTSTRPGSVLCVRGQEQDDPDLHPVQLKGESPDLVKVKPEESMAWQQRINGRSLNIGGTCTLMSPLLNPCSAASRGITASAKAELPTHGRWGGVQPITQIGSELQQSNPQHLPSPPDQLVKVQMPQQDSLGPPARGVGALESNSSFRYPPERPIKPVACFYILYRETDGLAKKEHYQAIYLMEREAKELISSIAMKFNFEPTRILQIINVKQNGLSIKVDDDVVRELPEGQDMILEFSRITAPVDAIFGGEQRNVVQNFTESEGYIVNLMF